MTNLVSRISKLLKCAGPKDRRAYCHTSSKGNLHRIQFFLLMLLVACQTSPTKIKENLTMGPNPDYARVITDQSIVLDARPLFAFTSSHLPNAQPVRWDFFGQKNNPGLLRVESANLARELARLGVAPDKHIVVVGFGKGGMGEEGRVAWMLSYLGVRNVIFARESFFQLRRQSGPVTPRANAEIWSPQISQSLLVDKKELEQAITSNNSNYRVIDVRNVDEYLGKHPESPRHPDIGAVNVPWTEFIDENGLPNKSIASQLSSIGVTRDKRVVLISEEGVRSALATQVLSELGYKNAGNFAGGFQELFAEAKIPAKKNKGKKK